VSGFYSPISTAAALLFAEMKKSAYADTPPWQWGIAPTGPLVLQWMQGKYLLGLDIVRWSAVFLYIGISLAFIEASPTPRRQYSALFKIVEV